RLGTAIKKLPENDYCTFHRQAIAIYNRRFAEFDDDAYILCFFLHSGYTGKTQKKRRMLMSQLRSYRCRAVPFDIPFADNESPTDYICQLANKLFSVTPHAAGCERIWSTLGAYNDDDELYEALSNMNLGDYNNYDEEEQSTSDKVQDDEFLEEEMLKIKELLNIDIADFMNDLGEIVFTANFESFEEEDGNIQNNDVESNVDENN
ncbi:32776_t:CDS:2, partial [Gigaspora margarita]